MHEPQNAASLSELVTRNYESVYRYAYRLTGSAADAEDLTQQTFLTAQRKLSQLREPAAARSWLLTIARNDYLKRLKREKSNCFVTFDSANEPVDHKSAVVDIDEERLQNALAELSEEFRTVVILFYCEDLSYKEIAAQLEIPIGTVMSRLARAKRHLRRRLQCSSDHQNPQHESPASSAKS